MASPDAPPTEGPRKPPLGGRLHYLIGGTLPAGFRSWVQHDLVGPGWRNRQALRLVIQSLPIDLVFLLLPGRIGVRVSVAVFLFLASVAMGYGTGTYFRTRRLVQHGLPVPKPVEEDEDDFPDPLE